jgi:RND family efflux transporter MFP subunit
MQQSSDGNKPSPRSAVIQMLRSLGRVVSPFIALACTEAREPIVRAPQIVIPFSVVAESPPRPRYASVVEPQSRRRLGFNVAGVLSSVRVQSGDKVSRGQLLADLEAQDAAAQLVADLAILTATQQEFSSLESLRGSGSVTARQLDRASVSLAQARAQQQLSHQRLQKAKLTAIVDGTVQERAAEPGEVVGPGVPVVVLDEAGPMRASFGCTDREIDGFAIGETAVVHVVTSGQVVSGRITSVSASPDARDGLYSVTVQLPVMQAPLAAGTLIEVESTRPAPPLLMVPIEAVVRRSGKPQVFLLEPAGDLSRVQRVEVDLGRAFGPNIALRSGVSQNAEIVGKGAYFLESGQVVRVRR